MQFFGVYYRPRREDGSPTHTFELCEVDGGTCYEAYRDRAEAQVSADESSRHSREDHGYTYDAYVVFPILAGTRVHDRETDSAVIAE